MNQQPATQDTIVGTVAATAQPNLDALQDSGAATQLTLDSTRAARQAFAEEHPYLAAPETIELEPPQVQLLFCPDSIWKTREAEEPSVADSVSCDSIVWRTSIFEGHSLQPIHSQEEMRNVTPTNGWLVGGLLTVTVLLCFFFRSHRLTLKETLPALFNHQQFEYIQHEKNLMKSSNFTLGTLLCAVTLAIALFSLPLDYLPDETDKRLWIFGAFTAGFWLMLMLHDGLSRLLGGVFDNASAISYYVLTGHLYQIIMTVCLLPTLLFLLCVRLSPTVHITLMALPIVCFWLLNLLKGIGTVLNNPNSTNFFLIYYLCILEIVPVVVVAKVLISI